ncbi:MAG TPA: hypothetical protein GXX55_10510 [Firmicutes bacterium]|nr:hypothetical protein [Bacillota bacterium]
MDKRAPFMHITNFPPKELSAREIWVECKVQPAAERRFTLVKDPVVVTGVYLKRPDQAKALAYGFLLALFVVAFLE